MKHEHSTKLYPSQILLFLLGVFFVFGIYAQEEKLQEPEKDQVVNKAISIDKIPDETEKIGKRIVDLRDILSPNANINELDSILEIIYGEVNLKKDSLLSQLENLSKRDLIVRKVEWTNYYSILKKYQATLKGRTEDISKINDELVEEILKWEQTKELLTKNTESGDIYDSLDSIILILQEIIEMAQNRLENLFIIQKDLTELVLTMDGILIEISLVEQQIQRDYFTFDSKPLWGIDSDTSIATDSLQIETSINSKIISSNFNDDLAQLKEFLQFKRKIFIFQIIFLLLTITSLFLVKKRSKNHSPDLNNRIERDAEIVLSNPISATVVVGVLISAFFYDEIIPLFGEIEVLLVFAGSVFLMPKLTNKKFTPFLLLLFIAYLLKFYEAYIESETFFRSVLILEGILLIAALLHGLNVIRKYSEDFEKITSLFRSIIPLYLFFSVIGIVANIIGMVGLSGFLIEGVMFSTILGMVVSVAIKVISSISILIFKLRRSYNIQTLKTMVQATNQRIQPILYWLGLIVWIYFTLLAFDLYHFLIEWLNDLLIVEWNIGEMTISLGGILAFTGILIATMIISKLISTIFQDDWMIKVLPRGVAPAISLLSRIILVSIGLYVGLSAAGLDLSKLGFVLGALGVGIGFGLQNVVLNFIAGLILAFERPINIGDAILIDDESGIVTNIGIRSSNIRTWDGTEAIIPNGDLISKKVINLTLSNRDRRSTLLIKTSSNANPTKVIELLNKIASEHPKTFEHPAPTTYFKGFVEDGNLLFKLHYWSTFSDTLLIDHENNLKIFETLKKEEIQAPVPVRRIINEK